MGSAEKRDDTSGVELGGDWTGYEEDDAECPRCHGDGMDPWNDYLLPCPLCQGEQRP